LLLCMCKLSKYLGDLRRGMWQKRHTIWAMPIKAAGWAEPAVASYSGLGGCHSWSDGRQHRAARKAPQRRAPSSSA